jgi:hypothetical protein
LLISTGQGIRDKEQGKSKSQETELKVFSFQRSANKRQGSGKDKNVSCPLSVVRGNDQAKAKGERKAGSRYQESGFRKRQKAVIVNRGIIGV